MSDNKRPLYHRLSKEEPQFLQLQEIGECPGCGWMLTAGDIAEDLVVWSPDVDYETTGNKIPYCRNCAEGSAVENG